MTNKEESLSNQTQNGSNENNQLPADNTTGTSTNQNNSNGMEEKNLNPGEDAQQQGGNVAAPEADGTKFEADKVYTLTDETVDELYLIKINRNVEKDIKAKLDTCEKDGMQVPAVVCDPIAVLEAGLQLTTVGGNTVTQESVDPTIPAILEGATRYRAWHLAKKKEENREINEDGTPYEAFKYIFIYNPNINKDNVVQTYMDINKYNVPTKGKDFARIAAAVNPLPVLDYYNQYVSEGLVPKAASFAAIGEELKKDEISKAHTNPSAKLKSKHLCGVLADVYEAVKHSVGEEVNGEKKMNSALAKNVPLHKYYGQKLKDAEQDERQAIAKKLVKMFKGLSASDLNRLKSAKADTKKGITKENAIFAILEELFTNVNK